MEDTNIQKEKGIVIATNEKGEIAKETFEYNQHREDLLDFSNLTTKENSILIDFNVSNGKVENIVKKIEQDGQEEALKSQEFKYDVSFKNGLLEPFLFEYAKNINNKIVITDITEDEKKGLLNYRMITENNDMVTVSGLERDYANYIAEEISKITYKSRTEDEKKVVLVKEINDQGKGDALVIALTIILIAVTLVGTIYFTIVANS